MPDPGTPGSPDDADGAGTPRPERDWERRRRLAEVFGDVLPDTTTDERGAAPAEGRGLEDPGERWLRDQVPPHHGS